MNGFRQRAAGTRGAQLAAQIGDLGTILEELDQRIVELAGIVQTIDKRQVELGKGTAEAYNALSATVDRLQTALGQNGLAVLTFFEMTWWQRLRWIVVGRWVVPPAAVVGDR